MRAWKLLGRIAFWSLLPALAVYLLAGKRTRVLVTSGEKVLVVKSWLGNGRWALPGGGLHLRETPLAGIQRELTEETGLVIPPETFRPLLDSQYRQHGLRFRYVCFSAELPRALGLTRQPWELTEVAWVDRQELTPDTANQDVCQAIAVKFKR